ncbi:uncharacterized protein LOC117178615 [Belonocnema kinseyi]|uniref:uncharacterized protein LOC117178615 n=1 Tax=Belonocnema kinseyi TaxID=2817044 RepID=UPI00143D554C|nr:uncharacterized protein LOC117178615 [Belonocnema kinseyi]
MGATTIVPKIVGESNFPCDRFSRRYQPTRTSQPRRMKESSVTFEPRKSVTSLDFTWPPKGFSICPIRSRRKSQWRSGWMEYQQRLQKNDKYRSRSVCIFPSPMKRNIYHNRLHLSHDSA